MNYFTKEVKIFYRLDQFDAIFYNKLKNFYGFPLNLLQISEGYNSIIVNDTKEKESRVSFAGIDGSLFGTLMTFLNFSVNYVGPFGSSALKNSKEMSTKFYSMKADLTFLRPFNFPDFSETLYLPGLRENCIFLSAQYTESSKEFIKLLEQLRIYPTIFGLLLYFFILNWNFPRTFPRNILLYSIFGGPVPNYRWKLIERFLILIFSVSFSFLEENYVTDLISIMSIKQPPTQFTCLDEFLDSRLDIKVLSYRETVPLLLKIDPRFESKIYPLNDSGLLDGPDLFTQKESFFMDCDYGKIAEHSPENFDYINNRKRFYMLETGLYEKHNTFTFRKFSPLVEKFKELIDRCYESGLYLFWQNTIQFRYSFITRRVSSALEEETSPSLLDFKIISVWSLFFAGLILSLFTAILELIFRPRKKISPQNQWEKLPDRPHMRDKKRYSFSFWRDKLRIGLRRWSI